MNKKLYILVIALTSLSLIGIIIIQGYWIKSAIDDKEEAFTYSIQQILNSVAKQIEQDEVDKYVAKFISLRESDHAISLKENHLREFIYVQENKNNKETFIYKHGILEEDYIIPASQQLTDQFGIGNTEDSITLKNYILQKSVQKVLNGNDLDVSESESVAYKKLSELPEIERVMIEELFKSIISQQTISERVSNEQLRGLITKLLKERGLNLPFEFAVYNKGVLSKVHSKYFEPNETKEYSTLLFGSNSPSDSLYELTVVFPQRERFVLSSIIEIATLSTIFVLTIIGVFIFTIHQLLTQRRISEIKTDFINNMTHEFKTPIATMNLVLDSLKSPAAREDPNKVLHYVQILKQENKRMLSQVENILQISRLEKDNLQLERDPLDVHEVIITAIMHLQPILNERNGIIRQHFLASNSDISANESHLTNVFVNVIENAIKYSPNSPEIDIYTENIKNRILIRVKDRGQGMNKQAVRHIFDKFYREHTGDLHNVKGHGLGLAYVKSIVEYHQGTITVQSDKDKGTTFFIKLPII
ncbi:sensor histidine kinase KdpD [Capnocytophaga sp. oral taxon 878]|uniref:sensor histidine kinase n=1 Tax=Capnocytophaga sp. oral taxon 878 TaxID=1316596 RepID=UPI000D02E593|nr:HAMP domain-containing sensor histidine kinase [Capnocytophaga sp. oral taxon 878]AVM50274.1 two-component sensor histidine kinase [Capnocytophaga sp. oral taxon 878]